MFDEDESVDSSLTIEDLQDSVENLFNKAKSYCYWCIGLIVLALMLVMTFTASFFSSFDKNKSTLEIIEENKGITMLIIAFVIYIFVWFFSLILGIECFSKSKDCLNFFKDYTNDNLFIKRLKKTILNIRKGIAAHMIMSSLLLFQLNIFSIIIDLGIFVFVLVIFFDLKRHKQKLVPEIA